MSTSRRFGIPREDEIALADQSAVVHGCKCGMVHILWMRNDKVFAEAAMPLDTARAFAAELLSEADGLSKEALQ